MKKIRKAVVLILVLCMSVGTGVVPAYGDDGTADSAYVYRYDGTAVETSSHRFTFQWMRGDTPWESVRNRNHAANIFQLNRTDETGGTSSAYCADFITSIISGAEYRCINLEDSTYYNDAAAGHIRAIIDKGYWYNWTSSDLANAEAAANAWLSSYEPESFYTEAFLPGDAEEDVEPISGLTADEALMATQLAIWAFANTEGDNFWVNFYESFSTEEAGVYAYEELPDNVKTFRKYLIHQQSRGLASEDIIFSDQYFVTDAVAFSGKIGGSPTYDLTLKVKLAVPVEEADDLELAVAMADRDPKVVSLTGQDAAETDDNGYYSIQFTGVTREEAEAGAVLTITGSQYVNDVYFYEARPAEGSDVRETSQNLVGKAEGLTPVSAQTLLQLELGTQTVALHKIDSETEAPLEGAVFDLYAEVAGKELLVYSGLTTDEKGEIIITDLPDGYNYYFRETAAPDGYEMGSTENIPVTDTLDGEEPEFSVVTNTKLPDPVPDPDDTSQTGDPVPDGSYQTGDDFDPAVYLALMALGVFAMAAAAVRSRKQNN